MLGKTIKEAVLVLLVATILSGAGYAVRHAFMSSSGIDAGNENPDRENGTISAIAFDDARVHFQNGTALFADARSLSAYQDGHIPGAMHLDPDEFDVWSGDFFTQVPPDRIIITYCNGSRCAQSVELAEKLEWMGYERVYFLKDGWGLWKENHLQIEPASH